MTAPPRDSSYWYTADGIILSKRSSPSPLQDLNSEFHSLLSHVQTEHGDESDKIFRRLSAMAKDFSHLALAYGRVIIAEKNLELKTIKPTQMGGIAGGEKYVAGDVIFRFENDPEFLYGSDEEAGKEKAHQLKGLTQIVSANVKGLKFPLMACVSYRGYRLLAVSRVPIGEDTLVLGSADAGRSIRSELSPRAEECAKQLAAALNLKMHRVKDEAGEEHGIAFPCDFELHQTADEQFYAVDYARLFPPEPISIFPNKSNCQVPHLVRLLRPELVKSFWKPLSSDAFSRFGALDREDNENDVLEAAIQLRDINIPNAARKLNEIPAKNVSNVLNSTKDASSTRDWIHLANENGQTIIRVIHEHGVNVRHLGRVYEQIGHHQNQWKNQILNESISRCVKAKVNAAMRDTLVRVRIASSTAFVSTATKELNTMLGKPPCTKPLMNCKCDAACDCLCTCVKKIDFYAVEYAESINQSTASSFEAENDFDDFDDESEFDRKRKRCVWWCKTLPQMLEIRFGFRNIRESVLFLKNKNRTNPNVKAGVNLSHERCTCCACGFSRHISRALILARVSEVMGLTFSPPAVKTLYDGVKSSRVKNSNPHTSSWYFLDYPLEENYLTDVQGSVQVLSLLDYAAGTAMFIKARNLKLAHETEEAVRIGNMALQSFERGIMQSPTDPRLLCNMGSLKEHVFESKEFKDQAITHYRTSVEKNPQHGQSFHYLAKALLRKIGGNAEGKIEGSRGANPGIDLSVGTGPPVSFTTRNDVDALFKKSVELNPEDVHALNDYAWFLLSPVMSRALMSKAISDPNLGVRVMFAQDLLKKALVLRPDFFVAADHLAESYEKAQRMHEAEEVYAKINDLPHALTITILARLAWARVILSSLCPNRVERACVPAADAIAALADLKSSMFPLSDGVRMVAEKFSPDVMRVKWISNCAKLFCVVGTEIQKRGRTCNNVVHNLFVAAAQMHLVYGITKKPSGLFMKLDEKRKSQSDKDREDVRKSHTRAIDAHITHVTKFCNCDIDKVGYAENLKKQRKKVGEYAAEWIDSMGGSNQQDENNIAGDPESGISATADVERLMPSRPSSSNSNGSSGRRARRHSSASGGNSGSKRKPV